MRARSQKRFTDEEKLDIALAVLGREFSHAEVCRRYDVSATYAYKLRDQAYEILKAHIGRPEAGPGGTVRKLMKKVEELEQLAGQQALAIKALRGSRRMP